MSGGSCLRKEAHNWLVDAEYDLSAARDLLTLARYSYVVFFCHQAVEKLLKALVIELKGELPPKTHNLRELLQAAGLEAPGPLETFLLKLAPHYLVSRYSDVSGGPAHLAYNKALGEEFLVGTEEVFEWLKGHFK